MYNETKWSGIMLARNGWVGFDKCVIKSKLSKSPVHALRSKNWLGGIILFMKIILILIIFISYTAIGQILPSSLSAHIATATNRVSTLNGLEFTMVITNVSTTNITFDPWVLEVVHCSSIHIMTENGRMLMQGGGMPIQSRPKTRLEWDAEHAPVLLKPGETHVVTFKLDPYRDYENHLDYIHHSVPPGKYRARLAFIPSNEVEIKVE